MKQRPVVGAVRRRRGIVLLVCVVVAVLMWSSSGGAQQKPSAAPTSETAAAPAQSRTLLAQDTPPQVPVPKKKAAPVNPAQRVLQPGDEGAAVFREDNPGQRERWFYEQRAYPLGYIPFGIRQRAVEARDAMRARERQLRIGSVAPSARTTEPNAAAPPVGPQTIPPSTTQWTPIGPQPVTSSFSTSIKQVSGRTSAVAVDPSNPNVVYVGGAQGGVWKTTDGGGTWTPLSDFEASLAIGAIAIDPANPQVVYVGTGEQTNSVGSYYGAGILKSTNGGATWTQLGQATFVGPFGSTFMPGGGARISSLAINPSNPQIILAGVQINTGLADAGVYCSNDGGMNWTQVLSGAMGTEVVYDPTPPGNIAYAALGRAAGDPQNGIYRSTNADQSCAMQTWAARNGTSPNVIPAGTAGRIEISIAPSSPGTLYASIAGATSGSNHLIGVFKTVDSGLNWSQLAPSNTLLSGTATTCSPQCWYDHVIRVHPNNPNVVYLGGSASGFTAGNYLIRTTDGGTNWSPIATDGVDRLHVDIQSMGFATSMGNATRLYVGNDGGVWSTDVSGGGAGAIDWVNHNGPAAGSSMALGTLQYYPGHSIHPGNPDFTIGGTQDNGTHIYTGSLGWTETNVCGDGGYTAIDPVVPTTIYAACQNIAINKTTNSGTNWFGANGSIPGETSAFIPPLIIDTNANVTPFARRQLYFGTFRIWRGDSDPNSTAAPTWTAISQDLNAGADVRAIAVSPHNSQIVWAGTELGTIHRTLDSTQLQTWQNVTGSGMLPPRLLTSLAIDPHDPTSNTVYATFSGFTFGGDAFGHVFRTTNGGAAWTDITANLPNTPVNDILMDPDVPGTLFIGTDVGVFASSNGGASWTTLDPAPTKSLPTVAVLGVKLHRPTRLLRVGTHGRGMWDLTLSNFNPTFNLASISPTNANAGDPNTPITVTGIGFSAISVVRFNGTNLATNTAGAPTQLTATIPAALLASGQTAQIDVFDPAQPAPSTTNGLPFSVTNPSPTLTSINPTMAAPGGPGFTLTLNGSNFVGTVGGAPTSEVRWNGSPRTMNAVLVSNNQITVDIPASDIASTGLNQVTVFNSSPGGGTTAPQSFTVGTPPPNDNFANAIIIVGNPFTDTQNNSAATTEANDPIPQVTTGCPANFGFPNVAVGRNHTIWYRFTPAANVTVTADTAGSSFDTVLSAWTGPALGALTQAGCDDDGVAAGGASRLSNLALTAGTTYHLMVAGFSPFDAGTAVFNFTIPPDFSVGVNPGAVTVTRGQASQAITVTVTPLNGVAFSNAVALSCTGLPSQSTCIFNPTSVTPGSNPANATLTITTTAPGMAPPAVPQGMRWSPPPVAVLALMLMATLLFAVAISGHAARRAPAWQRACFLLAIVLLAGVFVSCGGGGGGGGGPAPPPPNPGTPTGTFNVTVRGTSGATTRTATVTLTVQ